MVGQGGRTRIAGRGAWLSIRGISWESRTCDTRHDLANVHRKCSLDIFTSAFYLYISTTSCGLLQLTEGSSLTGNKCKK